MTGKRRRGPARLVKGKRKDDRKHQGPQDFLVEDNFEAMSLLKNMLTDLEVSQAYTAKDGKEALDFLGSCDDLIDLVLCDWNMPKMSGLDLLHQVRTVDPDLPFVMITGTADMESVAAAKSSGVTAYIVKPFSQDQLRKKLSLIVRMLKYRERVA